MTLWLWRPDRRILSPTPGPFVVTCRGSLIHVTRTSHHSVSNHLRFSTRRVPLPQRWPLYFVRASPCARRLARTADRIEFTLPVSFDGRRYGLVVHFQLLSTWGYRPNAVTFSNWPFSVGQVRDFHPAVPVRSQAHGRRALLCYQVGANSPPTKQCVALRRYWPITPAAYLTCAVWVPPKARLRIVSTATWSWRHS